MRAVVQRVSKASVSIGEERCGAIGVGLVILLGIEEGDAERDAEWLSGKIYRMRLFPDAAGTMNLSLGDFGGEALVVSQFTLHASTKKGNRPSYIRAARPEVAVPLYEVFLQLLEGQLGRTVARGEFGADMRVALVNEGPVTIVIDSKLRE